MFLLASDTQTFDGRALMNAMQQTALTNPCVEAEDTTHPRFKCYSPPWSIILTVNSGFE